MVSDDRRYIVQAAFAVLLIIGGVVAIVGDARLPSREIVVSRPSPRSAFIERWQLDVAYTTLAAFGAVVLISSMRKLNKR